jgi:hypothetical protein
MKPKKYHIHIEHKIFYNGVEYINVVHSRYKNNVYFTFPKK